MRIKQGQLVHLSALFILLVFIFVLLALMLYSADMTVFLISSLKYRET